MKKVCYLIPYYNAYDDLQRSLSSLHENVDVYIVDDGSSTPLNKILDMGMFNFNISIITATKNVGIERALNLGLAKLYGNYEYVARLDCGDLSAPDRLKLQVNFLDKYQKYVLVGSWACFVNEEYRHLFNGEVPTDDLDIRNKMYLNNMFIHPAVLMRLSAVKAVGGYPENRKVAEDYALFFKLFSQGKVANIPQPLISYVVSEGSVSSKKRTLQVLSRLKVILDNKKLNLYFIYGVFRSLLIFVVPRRVTTFIRKKVRVY